MVSNQEIPMEPSPQIDWVAQRETKDADYFFGFAPCLSTMPLYAPLLFYLIINYFQKDQNVV